MAFSIEDTLIEDFSGEIGTILKKIRAIPRMTTEKRKLVNELESISEHEGYQYFRGYSHKFHIGKVGQSYIYQVPKNKTGNLKSYRNKKVRLICMSSGSRWERGYAVGII